MPRHCLACSHPDRERIDTLLIQSIPNAQIGREFKLSENAVGRHRHKHLLPMLQNARALQAPQRAVDVVLAEARRPMDLYAEIEKLLRIAQSLLAKAAKEGKYGPAVEAVGKATRLLDLLGRLQGDLSPAGVTINNQVLVTQSPEWLDLRGRLLIALRPHPQALEAVMQALAAPNEALDERPKDAGQRHNE